jgi:hypothetical protein
LAGERQPVRYDGRPSSCSGMQPRLSSDDFVLATVRFLKQNNIDLDLDECFNIMNGMFN